MSWRPMAADRPHNLRGFERPATFPISATAPRPRQSRTSSGAPSITNGGPARAFSPIMPAFKDLLTQEQIDKVDRRHLRDFCTSTRGRSGDLNLPRALVTEKAFPENETVVPQSCQRAGRARRRLHGHLRAPHRRDGDDRSHRAVCDFARTTARLGRGVRRPRARLQAEAVPQPEDRIDLQRRRRNERADREHRRWAPAASRRCSKPLRHSGNCCQPAAFCRCIPASNCPRIPTKCRGPTTCERRSARRSQPTRGLGRRWSPMMEVIADRDLVSGATTNWDIVPQMQIPLSKRMHILGSIGFRIPVNNTGGPAEAVCMFYVLWDWVDGGLTAGLVAEARMFRAARACSALRDARDRRPCDAHRAPSHNRREPSTRAARAATSPRTRTTARISRPRIAASPATTASPRRPARTSRSASTGAPA